MTEVAKADQQSTVIRGLRTMAIVRWILLAAVALLAGATWWIYVLGSTPVAHGPDKYYCPMHPQIRSAVPGACPICFMKLEPIPEERTAPTASAAAAGEPSPARPGEPPAGMSNVMLTLERRQAVGIATAEASRRVVARELRLPAVIEPLAGAVSEIRVRTTGFVERVADLETGTRVRAGEPLLWVYSPELLRAQEEVLTARRMRQSELSGSSAGGSTHGLGERVSEAARERLVLLGVHPLDIERLLERGQAERTLPIRAPLAGIVTARAVAVGTQATPEMMLFQITNLSRVWASATVSADSVSAVSRGAQGRFVSRLGGRSYEVEAALVEPRLLAETRTAVIRFSARNSDLSLLPGDIGEVLLSLPAIAHVLVPRDAVIDLGSHQYVFVEQAAGLFVPRIVHPGPLIGEERGIVSGLEAGERVVSRGAFVLDSESRLQAALAPSPAPPGSPPPAASAPQHQHGAQP